jgi:hypothetical protein
MASARREMKAEEAQAARERRQSQRDIETYEGMAEHGIDPTNEAEAAVQLAIAEKGHEAYGKAFELDPTVKNYKMYEATARDIKDLKNTKSKLGKQQQAASFAQDALAAEQARIHNSRMLDLSNLDERTVGRVERSYKKAQHDTYYLNKNNPKEGSK